MRWGGGAHPQICGELGCKLGCDTIGDLHSQFHHAIWCGDFNYHVKADGSKRISSADIISYIAGDTATKQLEDLYDQDELHCELQLDQLPEERFVRSPTPSYRVNFRLKYYLPTLGSELPT
jgi:hypothetical protein